MPALVLKSPSNLISGGLGNWKDLMLPPAGVKFAFDLGSALSWAKMGAPANGDAVLDLAGGTAGSAAVTAGQTVNYAGGGWDFSACSARGELVVAPAGCLADIAALANAYFMVASYVKLPTSGNWSTGSNVSPIFCCTTNGSGYAAETDMVTVDMGTGGVVHSRRQTAGATIDAITVSAAAHYGLVTQVAYWRNAAGQGVRLRSSAGTTIGTMAVGAENAASFAAKVPRWGVTESFTSLSAGSLNWRLFRGWIENLAVSGRDPVTVLDADYARTIARNVFS